MTTFPGETISAPSTFREALERSNDLLDLLRLLPDVEEDCSDLMEIFVTERRGGYWIPEEQRVDE